MRTTAFRLWAIMAFFCSIGYGQTSIESPFTPKESIIENTQKSKDYNTLLAVMEKAELTDVLDSQGPFTVFAPSDEAFNKLNESDLRRLLNEGGKKELKSLAAYHVVAGNFTASKILKAMCRGGGYATFTTVQGNEILATMDGIDIVLTDCSGNQARITSADTEGKNGVIHRIDSVILPKQL